MKPLCRDSDPRPARPVIVNSRKVVVEQSLGYSYRSATIATGLNLNDMVTNELVPV